MTSTVVVLRAQAKTQAAYVREQRKTIEAERHRKLSQKSFLQAREAVDFFARLAADELTSPEDYELRRRLLETALVYYESFVDHAVADESLQLQLELTRRHITMILGELEAMDQLNQVTLNAKLSVLPVVSEQLQLSPQQIQLAASVNATLPQQIMEQLGDTREMDTLQRKQVFARLASETELLLGLSQAQLDRLRQIARQARGCDAFTDPANIQRLRLDASQLARIRAEQKNLRDRLFDIRVQIPRSYFQRSDLSDRESDEMLMALQAIEMLLTPSQLAVWRDLTGKPVADLWVLLNRRHPHYHGQGKMQ